MEALPKSLEILKILSSCNEKHTRVRRSAAFATNVIALFREYMQSRITTNNRIDEELSNQINSLLHDIEKSAVQVHRISGLSNIAFWLSGACGSFGKVNRVLAKMDDETSDLNTLLEFVKINLISNSNELLYRYSGVYDVSNTTTCKDFWFMLFGSKFSVPLEVFKDGLIALTDCDSIVAKYIACRLSEQGMMHIDTFVDKTKDPQYFDVKAWVIEQQTSGLARTVLIPGHVRKINMMRVIGKTIITCSADHTLKVFDPRDNGQLVLRTVLVGHEQDVNSFIGFKRGIISTSNDKSIRYWDVNIGDLLHTYYVDKVITKCRWLEKDAKLACVVPETSYAIMVYDICNKCFTAKFAIDGVSVRGIEVDGETVYACVENRITRHTMQGKRIQSLECKQGNTRMFLKSRDDVIVSSSTGVDIYDADDFTHKSEVIFFESRANIFVIDMFCDINTLYILWNFGHYQKTCHFTILNIATTDFEHRSLNITDSTYYTHILKYGDHIYCSNRSGQIVWLDVDREDILGCTESDQFKLGLDYNNVNLATSQGEILVTNNGKATKYNMATESQHEIILPYSSVGCVFHISNYVIASTSTVYWYDMSLNCINTYKSNWTIEKVISCNQDLLLLYTSTSRMSFDNDFYRSKYIAIWDCEIEEFRTLENVQVNHILVADDKYIYASILDAIAAFDMSRFCVTSTYVHGQTLAISGCKLGERMFTLHSHAKVIIWLWSFVDMVKFKTCDIAKDVISIREFNKHILGLSTSGSVYVYDEDMKLQRCIVTHAARSISSTPGANDEQIDVMVVTDQKGVIKVLAELYSNI